MYAQSYGLEPAHHAGIGTIATSSPIMLGEQKASKSENYLRPFLATSLNHGRYENLALTKAT